VSLAPSVTEALFAIGAGAEVVGDSQYCDYPPAARKLPKIGTFLTPNIEAIAALRPSLVIGLETSSDLREIRAIEAMGISTLMVSDQSIGAIEESVVEIGARIGRKKQAKQLADSIHAEIERVREKLRATQPVRVLMIVGHQPMVAVGPGTYLDEVLKTANARNIADASQESWPRLSMEYIIASRPQVILDGEMGTDPNTPATFWARYTTVPAVRNHRVYGYPDDPVLHPGPRVGETLAMLARLIHPAAFQSGTRIAETAR
jgi:cobalamin transport system substrate-binding protein